MLPEAIGDTHLSFHRGPLNFIISLRYILQISFFFSLSFCLLHLRLHFSLINVHGVRVSVELVFFFQHHTYIRAGTQKFQRAVFA